MRKREKEKKMLDLPPGIASPNSCKNYIFKYFYLYIQIDLYNAIYY